MPAGVVGQDVLASATATAAQAALGITTGPVRIDGVSGATGAATLTLTKSGGASAALDIQNDYTKKALRILGPPDIAGFNPVTYIGNGGEIATRAWLKVSGATTGSGDTYDITDPIPSGTYPYMVGIGSDVAHALVVKAANAAGTYILTCVDHNSKFRFMVPEDGSLQWGSTSATTPAGVDTGLSRIGAASMALGNGTAADYTGNLKLTTLTFADASTMTSAGVGSASSVTGLTVTSGKTLTATNTITLSGTDSTVMTFPASSATMAGIGITQTWSARQDFSSSIRLANNTGIEFTLSGGSSQNILGVDSGNALTLGSASIGGHLVFVPATSQQIRFLNAASAAYIMSMQESTRKTCIGGNTFDGTLTVYDPTASTGDTILCIKAGAAREARVRFANSSGTYDVGLQRDAAGSILNVTDAGTTATTYRDLRARYHIGSLGTPAAAGANQGAATAIVTQYNAATGADGAKGVSLPAPVAGQAIFIVNTVAASALLVYPASGGTINGLSQDAAFSVAGGAIGVFIPTSTTQWRVAPHA